MHNPRMTTLTVPHFKYPTTDDIMLRHELAGAYFPSNYFVKRHKIYLLCGQFNARGA